MEIMEIKEKEDCNDRSENNEQKEYKKLQLQLKKLQDKKKPHIILSSGILTVIMFISITFPFCYTHIGSILDTISYLLIFAFAAGILVIYAYYHYLNSEETKLCLKIAEYEANLIKDEVGEDIFKNSIKMTYSYLDQYYSQTREQAQKGFNITFLVAISGAVLLAIGIIAMFFGKTEPSYITCASGVITEFIAAIFFYLYNRTITSMSKYHNKLVLSHNISIALKVADTLPSEDKVKSKNMIINELTKDINTYLIKGDSEENKK